MKTIGLSLILSDQCVYKDKAFETYIAVHVDDGLICGISREKCSEVVNRLNTHFDVKIIENNIFLGMELIRTNDTIQLSQKRYIDDITKRFELTDAGKVC